MMIVLVAALLALSACGDGLDTARQGAEIASEGGTRHLRDTLRAPAGPPRVLIFALDGVGEEALREALEGGALPTLSALLGARTGPGTFAHGVSIGPVLSVLPSITIAAWTTIFTGAPPGETGVPGNEWFDREVAEFYAPAPVSVTGRGDAMANLSDQLLDSLVAVPTLFERADVRSYVSLLPVHRGADILALPGSGELADLFASFPRGAAGGETVDREVFASVDRASGGRMAELVASDGLPDLGVVYFPGIDLYTHATPNPLVEQRIYLAEVTEPAMAEVMAAYRDAGAMEGLYVVVTSDHGHTPVPSDATHALGGDSAFSAQRALEEAGFRVRPLELDTPSEDFQAVMAWQGAFAYISLSNRSTCLAEGVTCPWPRPPRWDDDVLPAARALAGAAARHPTRPLDMVLLRRDAPGGEGSDLYVLDEGQPVELDAYLRANPRPELLAFSERLGWLTDGPHGDHSGDVILMARLGASSPHSERYYFSNPYHSWHASAEAQDSHTPLLVARSDLSGDQIAARIRPGASAEPTQLEFTGTVLQLLERTPEGRSDRSARARILPDTHPGPF